MFLAIDFDSSMKIAQVHICQHIRHIIRPVPFFRLLPSKLKPSTQKGSRIAKVSRIMIVAAIVLMMISKEPGSCIIQLQEWSEKHMGRSILDPERTFHFLQYASRIIVAMGQRRSNHAVILWQRVELSSELARLVKVTFMQNSQEGRVGMVPIFCN